MQLLVRAVAGSLVLTLVASCGGGGSDGGGSAPLSITTTTTNAGVVGIAYTQTISATGGSGTRNFSVSAGALPAGLALSAVGVISGTPAGPAGSANFTVSVTDTAQQPATDTQALSIDVVDPLVITTTALPDATGGESYSASLEAQGGLLPLTWTLTAGTLPAGLTGPDPASGAIGGTPDPACVAAAAALTVQVTDSGTPAQSDTQAAISLAVEPAALEITTATLPAGTVGAAYNTIVGAAGVPPYSFAITAGTLPSQLGINEATGQITGAPDTVEAQAFDVTVTDACPNTVTRTLGITISISLGRNDTIADATVLPGNGTYSASISPSGHPNTVYAPDEDYYAITTTAASTVTVDINAAVNGSPLDSVIEIVDVNGLQLSTCGAPAFVDACAHDDEDPGIVFDSLLQLQVASATTFYIHVVDWSGNARPDKLYDLVISGVN